MTFKGTIIITDPCYIMRADNVHIIGTGSTNFFTIQTAF